MPVTVCPVANARVPCERVWALLSDSRAYDSWWDAETVSVVPPGPVEPGQVMTLRSRAAGRWWTVRIHVDEVDVARHALSFSGSFPFGIGGRTRISCAPLDPFSCRVQFG
jgi:hypothetical protein